MSRLTGHFSGHQAIYYENRVVDEIVPLPDPVTITTLPWKSMNALLPDHFSEF
jgi:CRISPR/Cas system-associated protein Csm6